MCAVRLQAYTKLRECDGEMEPIAMSECPSTCLAQSNRIEPDDGECNLMSKTMTRRWKYRDPFCQVELLPAPVAGVPCHVSCLTGNYRVNYKTKECAACPAGTEAASRGTVFTPRSHNSLGGNDTAWAGAREVGYPFETHCYRYREGQAMPESACPGWVVSPLLSSGNNTDPSAGAYDSIQSVLTLPVKLVRRGLVRFWYRVESDDPRSGLRFSVDGTFTWAGVRRSPELVSFSRELDRGYHTLKWVFLQHVDGREAAAAARRNWAKAEIATVQVEGQHWTGFRKEECLLCPAGTFSNRTAAERCAPCPENTFSGAPGASACTACPAGHYSHPQSVACQPRPACTEHDMYRVLGPCEGNLRQARYAWRPTTLCDPARPGSAKLLPDPPKEPCSRCGPGTEPDGDKAHACRECPAGSFSRGNGTACAACPAGQAAARVQVVEQIAEWPSALFVATSCEDAGCATGGWALAGDGTVDSGRGHFGGVASDLEVSVHFATEGVLSLTYGLVCEDYDSCNLKVSVDGEIFDIVRPLGIMSDDRAVLRVPERGTLPAGVHNFTLSFNKYEGFSFNSPVELPSDERAILYRLEARGTARGGARLCAECDAGHEVSKGRDRCEVCAPGWYRSKDMPACGQCPAETFCEAAGCAECAMCGEGTTTRGLPGATACAPAAGPCALFDPSTNSSYSLAAIGSRTVSVGGRGDSKPVKDPASGSLVCPELVGPALPAKARIAFALCERPPASSLPASCEGAAACEIQPPDDVDYVGSAEILGKYLSLQPFSPPPAVSTLGSSSSAASASDSSSLNNNDTLSTAATATFFNFTGATGVSVGLWGGDICENSEGAFVHRTLWVSVVCDLTAGAGGPELWPPGVSTPTSGAGPCAQWLLWRSRHGCRLCKEGDYFEATTSCVGGKRTRQHLLRDGAQCWGGHTVPAPAAEPCGTHVRIPFLGFVLAGAAGAALLGAALYFYIQNRRIYAEYTSLRGGGGMLSGEELVDMRGAKSSQHQQQRDGADRVGANTSKGTFKVDDDEDLDAVGFPSQSLIESDGEFEPF